MTSDCLPVSTDAAEALFRVDRRGLRETLDRDQLQHPPVRVRRADAQEHRHRDRRPPTAPRPRPDHRRPGQLPARPSDRRQGGEALDLNPSGTPRGGEKRRPPRGCRRTFGAEGEVGCGVWFGAVVVLGPSVLVCRLSVAGGRGSLADSLQCRGSRTGSGVWRVALGWEGQAIVAALRCWWSLSRLPARLMSAHSLRTASRPRRRKLRIWRLCLRSPKTGSISWERCL